MPLGWQAK